MFGLTNIPGGASGALTYSVANGSYAPGVTNVRDDTHTLITRTGLAFRPCAVMIYASFMTGTPGSSATLTYIKKLYLLNGEGSDTTVLDTNAQYALGTVSTYTTQNASTEWIEAEDDGFTVHMLPRTVPNNNSIYFNGQVVWIAMGKV